MTPLDKAHAAMEADPENERLRLGFYERLSDAELFVLLEQEPVDASLSPTIFDTSDGQFVLAFDLEERLSQFIGEPAPYASLSGRAVAEMLAGKNIGLGLNLGVAASSFLVPAGALDWLTDTLRDDPREIAEKFERIASPTGLPDRLISSLDSKLASARGLARMAYLVGVTYSGDRPGHLLAIIDAEPGAEAALARAMSEALVFSGVEAGTLDIAFFAASAPISAKLAKHGLRFDLPQIDQTKPPSCDPTKPPRLR